MVNLPGSRIGNRPVNLPDSPFADRLVSRIDVQLGFRAGNLTCSSRLPFRLSNLPYLRLRVLLYSRPRIQVAGPPSSPPLTLLSSHRAAHLGHPQASLGQVDHPGSLLDFLPVSLLYVCFNVNLS